MTFAARGAVSIVGVGHSEFHRAAPPSIMQLARTAIDTALGNAALDIRAVDGLLSYHLGDSVAVTALARALGMPRLRWHNELWGGGSQSASVLIDAALAIANGLAETVVVYRALHARSGQRLNVQGSGAGDGLEQDFIRTYGARGPVNMFALVAQRWLHERGQVADDLYAVIARQRAFAAANPRALCRQPLSRAEYLAAPLVSTPLRRPDCCLETDAAVALVLMKTERALRLGLKPVAVLGGARGGGPGGVLWDKAPALDAVFSRYIAAEVWRSAQLTAAEVDLVYPYDAYSFLVPLQLEDFGFCAPGDGIGFVASGDKPINTHGGLLCEGYVHGLNSVAEAVIQLAGTAGARQQARADTALCTGFGGHYGAATVLQRAW